MSYSNIIVSITVASLIVFALATGETCESPQFKVTSYSTTDAQLVVEAAGQLEITVKCKNGKPPSTLYADIYGQIVPCAQATSTPGKYFIGVSAVNHKQLPKGSVTIKLYDDEAYSAVRKARTEDAIKAVKAFGEVEFNHPGTGYGSWLAGELFALIIFGLVWWAAYRERSKVLA